MKQKDKRTVEKYLKSLNWLDTLLHQGLTSHIQKMMTTTRASTV